MEISRIKNGEVYRPFMGDYEKDTDNKYIDPPSLLLKFVVLCSSFIVLSNFVL